MATPIICVENLGKKYIRGQRGRNSTGLRHVIEDALRHPWKFLTGVKTPAEEFWALRNVSFELEQGDVLGIIGRNGAGKSTFLKLLSRVTLPTEGSIRLRGRIASLLEVGTGFHLELTGRENIFLNGSILGMTRTEIKKKFDAIVSFAEVEDFIDTPVKHYSSGMFVRLAFAVAAHLEPEILIVDEVLAVGDSEFQKKCIGKMEHVATKEGKTVLFVSHNMGSIRHLCNKGLLLDKGRLQQAGKIEEVVSTYLKGFNSQDGTTLLEGGEKDFHFESIQTRQENRMSATVFGHDEPVEIIIRYYSKKVFPLLQLTLIISNATGTPIFTVHRSIHQKEKIQPGNYEVKIKIPGKFLAPDRYLMSLLAFVPKIHDIIEEISPAASFEISETGSILEGYGTSLGVVIVPFSWEERSI